MFLIMRFLFLKLIQVWAEESTHALSLKGSGVSLGISVHQYLLQIFYYIESVLGLPLMPSSFH